MSIEIGRLCVKTCGRDANKKCLILDILDKNFVLIDGETRRRKCNILHLEPLDKVLNIKKSASHDEVKKALSEIGIETIETKQKQKAQKPRKLRKKDREKGKEAKAEETAKPQKPKKEAPQKKTPKKSEAKKEEKKVVEAEFSE